MKKHILIILCVFSSIFLIAQVVYTYSLFETERQTVVTSPIAKWNVLVNNSLLTNNYGQENTFNLGSINWNSGGHVRSGKAAPGSVGTFEIEIDPTDTEVSFLYELDIDTWPGIPTYVEVEGKSETDLENILNKLDYSMKDTVSCTADEIYEKYGLSMFDSREIKFENYDH